MPCTFRKVAKLATGILMASTVGVALVVPGCIAYGSVRIAGAFCDANGKKMNMARSISLMMAGAPVCIGIIAAAK